MRDLLDPITPEQIDLFMVTYGRYFLSRDLETIHSMLESSTQADWKRLIETKFYDPSVITIFSLVGGYFGLDRFMRDDVTNGVLKLITCGGLGIWTMVDWFISAELTAKKNFELFLDVMDKE